MILLDATTVTNDLIEKISDSPAILLNLSEPHSLFPLHTFDRFDIQYGFHEYGVSPCRVMLYTLYTMFNKGYDITYVTPDINIANNIKLIKKRLNIEDTDVKINLFPWYFLFEYFWNINNYQIKEDIELPIEYSAIFLSGGKRLCRMHILSELSVYDNFLYSNMGYPEQFDPEYEVVEYVLNDDFFSLILRPTELQLRNWQEQGKTIYKQHGVVKMSTDNSMDTISFKINNFDSTKIKYFIPDLNKIKQPRIQRESKLPYFKYNIVPDEYLKSAVSLGCETQTDLACHITEKTIKNFFYKKPFLNFGAKHYYKFLTEQQFVLYDELFNYSFDDIELNGLRLKKYMEECKKMLNLSLNDLINIINQKTLKDKLDHNYNVCLKIKQSLNHDEKLGAKNISRGGGYDNCIRHVLSRNFDNITMKNIA